MKNILKILFFIGLIFNYSNAESIPENKNQNMILQSGSSKLYCSNCAMSLPKHYRTNYAVKLKSGGFKQFCSIYCLVEFLDFSDKNNRDKINKILVVDAHSGEFINAKKARYIIGSKLKGTMSKISKFAFKKESDARDFQAKNGGKYVNFEIAYRLAKDNFEKDNNFLQTKKDNKIYKKGKIIYNMSCNKEALKKLNPHTIADLKYSIEQYKLCTPLKNEMQKQAISIYYWDIILGKNSEVIKESKHNHTKQIKPTKDRTCPVCGMFVSKFPNWLASINFQNAKHTVYFDGAKDMFKYYFNQRKYSSFDHKFKDILVTDYYSLKAVSAKDAYFVINSNVYGPMGKELVPFSSKERAINFSRTHSGSVLKFSEVTKYTIKSLDK